MKIKNPLEETFNIAPIESENEQCHDLATVEDTYAAVPENSLTPPVHVDDEEDKEINSKIEQVFTTAMEAYNTQTAYMEVIEPRYAARNAEVANNYLNTALNAVSLKARVKNDKRKAATFIPFKNQQGGGTNIVVADRNQILSMMDNGQMPYLDSDKI